MLEFLVPLLENRVCCTDSKSESFGAENAAGYVVVMFVSVGTMIIELLRIE